MHESWKKALAPEFQKPYFKTLADFVTNERRNHTVYPPEGEVFNALKLTPLGNTKVVILGQDPYHGAGQAHGLSFSVKPGVPVPPSLVNIYKELKSDLGIPTPTHGHLIRWAERGVLLLNSVLTVRAHDPGSHAEHGWETFTDAVVQVLNERPVPMVFLLWGKHAQRKGSVIDRARHTVLEAAHPSPFSASNGFFGSRPFSATNQILGVTGIDPINWEP